MCDNIDAELMSPVDLTTTAATAAGAGSPFDRRMYRSLGGHNASSQFGGRAAPPTHLVKNGSLRKCPLSGA